MSVRIGVDIGGTFTDLVIYDEASGELTIGKVPTTPASPEQGCVEAVREHATSDQLTAGHLFLHGTTVGLNALLERRGATVGLLCTSGFRDVIEIRRGARSEAYSLFWQPPPPLVPRYLRLPVKERISAQGEVVQPLEPASVLEALRTFQAHGVGAIAVCLMNAYRNPAHELAVASALREAGYAGVISLSHQLSRDYRDYERTSTTCVDAFVQARMADYLDRVETGLQALHFAGRCLITRSGGGSMSFAEAKARAFETVNSGPVAGAEGAAELSRAADLGDLVTADVGGTSFDTCLILAGRPQVFYQGSVAGMPIQAPWVDVRSIGAGGGSIASIDSGGLLQVGPRSAGAQPGPACYGRGGTEPTVTDAVFHLGMLGNGHLASGLVLDAARAADALGRIAGPLALSRTEAAIGIVQIAAANMANAVREITIEQGVDPRSLKLLAFGGAGPMLATQIARELGMGHVVIPAHAGNFSAWGLLGADLVRSAGRTERMPLSPDSLTVINARIREMIGELHGRGGDLDLAAAEREVALAMRFKGQEHSLTVPMALEDEQLAETAEQIREKFRATYQRDFGVLLENPIEIIAVRCALRRRLPRRRAAQVEARSGNPAGRGTARVHSFALGKLVDAVTVERRLLTSGERIAGPAILYEDTTTTYVDSDFVAEAGPFGCLHLTHAKSALRQEG